MPCRLRTFISEQLCDDEIREITNQFSHSLIENRQVLWTGMTRELAQRWANDHDTQTLATAMGPLMNTSNDRCPRKKKSDSGWTTYIHGASALFAWHISQGQVVTVLTHAPPQRFHPSGLTSFQLIEEPIITGKLGNRPVQVIKIVHPAIPTAADFSYQFWPLDEVSSWMSSFGQVRQPERWRMVKSRTSHSGLMTSKRSASQHDEDIKTRTMIKKPFCTILAHETKNLAEQHSKQRDKMQQRESRLMQQLLQKQEAERYELDAMSDSKSKKRKPTQPKEQGNNRGGKRASLLKKQSKARKKLRKSATARREALETQQTRERQNLQISGQRKCQSDGQKADKKIKSSKSRKKSQGQPSENHDGRNGNPNRSARVEEATNEARGDEHNRAAPNLWEFQRILRFIFDKSSLSRLRTVVLRARITFWQLIGHKPVIFWTWVSLFLARWWRRWSLSEDQGRD